MSPRGMTGSKLSVLWSKQSVTFDRTGVLTRMSEHCMLHLLGRDDDSFVMRLCESLDDSASLCPAERVLVLADGFL